LLISVQYSVSCFYPIAIVIAARMNALDSTQSRKRQRLVASFESTEGARKADSGFSASRGKLSATFYKFP